MTICWYMDNLFMAYQLTNIIREFVDWLEDIYSKLSVKIRDELEYLGMKFKFMEDKVKVLMKGFTLGIIITDFPEEINFKAKDLAWQRLFEIVKGN